jgi:hypothetical protein
MNPGANFARDDRFNATREGIEVILSSRLSMILKYDYSGWCPATASGEEAECFLLSTT